MTHRRRIEEQVMDRQATNRLSKSLIVPPCTREAQNLATGRKEGDISFVSNMFLSFNAQRTDARIVDGFLKARLSNERLESPEKLPTMCQTLNRLQKEPSVEQKCQCAYDYVTKLVVASTLLKEDKNAMSRMQPMLQWVISVFLPTFGERVYRLVGSESTEATRSTVTDLLSHIGNTSCSSSRTRDSREAVLSSGSSSRAHTAGQAVALAAQVVVSPDSSGQAVASAAQAVVGPDARPCERCYLCLRLIPVPDELLVCRFRDESPDKVPCSVGYCRPCIRYHKEEEFWCASHQTRPKSQSRMFKLDTCWDCPPGTLAISLRYCFWCGKGKCHVCGLFDEANLKNSSWKYFCPRCQDDPKSLYEDVKTRWTVLLRKSVGNGSINADQFSLSLCKTDHLNTETLQKLVDAVYDASQAGLFECARPFIKAVTEIDVRSAHSWSRVVTHPSQYLRMYSGTTESRKVQQIISKAFAAELVAQTGLVPCDEELHPRWTRFVEAEWQTAIGSCPKVAIWMHDAAFSGATGKLVTYQLTELCKSDKFSSIVLCGRKVSASVSYHKDDGAVSKLISCFKKAGNLMLFDPTATHEHILEFFDGANVDILLDLTSFSGDGLVGLPGVFAKLRTACKIAYIGYPCLHYGIYDFIMLQKNVLNPDCMQSNDRERTIITDGMYPPVGYHNGHHDTKKDWEGKLVVPEGCRPLLVFLGDGSKLRDESLFAWMDILAGTGDGQDSALLMLLQSSETVMQEVEQWRKTYNEMREGSDVIMPGRIRWFSYRSTQELWGWCGLIRGRAIGVSCLGPYDVHTLVNDELYSGLCHLALRTPGQDWSTLVAPALVEHAGLGEMFIANSVSDFKRKGIMLALKSSQVFLLEASNHLLRCRDEKIGLFDLKQPVLNLERALILGWTKFREANGVRNKLSDIDLTKLFPVRETRLFSPRAAAADSISESGEDQARRVLNQLHQTHPAGLAICRDPLEKAVLLHHGLGFRKMCVVGVGSTTICVHASNEGGEKAIKITHFFHGKAQQEDRLATDANFKAAFCFRMAHVRRANVGKLILPEMFRMYQCCGRKTGLIAIIQGSARSIWFGNTAGTQGIARPNSKIPARSRPVITCSICEFVQGGTLSTHTEFQRLVREYRNEGNISHDFTRVVQAILFSVCYMNRKGIVNFDISNNNLALRRIGYRWIAVWIDTGASIVFDESVQPPLAARSVTSARTEERFHGTLPVGPAEALHTPIIPKYINGMSFVNGEKVDETFQDARCRQQLTNLGTETQRDEEFFNTLKKTQKASKALIAEKLSARDGKDASRQNAEKIDKALDSGLERPERIDEIKQLTLEDGVRCDSCSGTLIALQMFHPAPKDKSDREKWKKDLSAACDSPDNMVAFLQAGLNVGVPVKRADVLSSFGKLFYDLLRKNWRDRITLHEALLRLVFTTDTLSLEDKQTMDGKGFVFPESDCPVGSPWQIKGLRLPEVLVLNEPGIGPGVMAGQDLVKGQLVLLYSGIEASAVSGIDVSELPPSRRTTFARQDGMRLHAVADQPFWMLRQKNTAGPLVNAADAGQAANLSMKREDFWRDEEGHIYIALYAIDNIVRGTFLRWEYDPFAGGGGKDSYRFGTE